eukprot:11187589-Alexandrium_andersonii.AAC.1
MGKLSMDGLTVDKSHVRGQVAPPTPHQSRGRTMRCVPNGVTHPTVRAASAKVRVPTAMRTVAAKPPPPGCR